MSECASAGGGNFDQSDEVQAVRQREIKKAYRLGTILLAMAALIWIVTLTPYMHDPLVCTRIIDMDTYPDFVFQNGRTIAIEGYTHLVNAVQHSFTDKPVLWYKLEKQIFDDMVVNRAVVDGDPDNIDPSHSGNLKLKTRTDNVKGWQTIDTEERFLDFRIGDVTVAPGSAMIYLDRKCLYKTGGFDVQGHETRQKYRFMELPERLTVAGDYIDGEVRSGKDFRIGKSRSRIGLSDYKDPVWLIAGFISALAIYLTGLIFIEKSKISKAKIDESYREELHKNRALLSVRIIPIAYYMYFFYSGSIRILQCETQLVRLFYVVSIILIILYEYYLYVLQKSLRLTYLTND